jgi:hypothetical protein
MKKILFIVCAITVLMIPATGRSLSFNIDTLLSGTAPQSAAPWLTLTFTDNGTNAVQLRIESSLEVSTEFIRAIVFNVDPSITLSALSFGTGIKTQGSFDPPTIAKAQDLQSINPAGGFDIALTGFATANNANKRFDSSDILTYNLTYLGSPGSFNANSFNFYNTDPQGQADFSGFYAVAMFQGIQAGDGSGKWGDKVNGVPEPSTLLLLGAGLVGFGILGRRKFRS